MLTTILLLAAASVPQSPAARPPTVSRLGELPDAPVAAVVDGTERLPRGEQLIVQADRDAPFAAIAAALGTVAASGTRLVHFAAALPDGTVGGVSLALPTKAEIAPTLVLRAHHERPGVPVDGVVPVLRRLGDGWRAAGSAPFVLRLELPANASHQQFVQLLAAVATAGVDRVVVQSASAGDPADEPVSRAALAFDLDGAVRCRIEPRAVAAGRPTRSDSPFGAVSAATQDGIGEPRGGAGGRYGGRTGAGNRLLALADVAAGLERSLAWLGAQQRPDGSLGADDGARVEATALFALALLGQGTTLDAGERADALRRAVGWLVARQHDDGTFAASAPGAWRAQALAAYALVEAYGLSGGGALVRTCATDALGALVAHRSADGGFADGAPGAASDAVTTAFAVCALASAGFFRLPIAVDPGAPIAWFDAHARGPDAPVEEAAAESFARCFANGSTAGGRPPAIGNRLAAATDPARARASYWTTFALYQAGGPAWQAWSRRLSDQVVAAQIGDGPLAGTWPEDAAATRVVDTGYRALTLEVWFRYSRLVR